MCNKVDVIISKHAKERIKTYNLTEKIVIETVKTPDEVIEEFGADSLRMYEMFIGALQDTAVWQTENIWGIKRFLDKVWRLFFPEGEKPKDKNSNPSTPWPCPP